MSGSFLLMGATPLRSVLLPRDFEVQINSDLDEIIGKQRRFAQKRLCVGVLFNAEYGCASQGTVVDELYSGRVLDGLTFSGHSSRYIPSSISGLGSLQVSLF